MDEMDDYLFEKASTLEVDATNPAIVSVRPSESLEIVRCAGQGRLFVSVSEASSSQVVVDSAIVYDSDAYRFQQEPVLLNHVLVKDALACALVEFHVDEHTPKMQVDIHHTFHFSNAERRTEHVSTDGGPSH